MFEGGNMSSALNYKNIILYIILVSVIAICVMYFFNILEVKPFINGLIAQLPPLPTSLGNIPSQIGQVIQDNATTLAGIAIPSVIGLITYVRYRGELKAKQELLEMQTKLQEETYNLETTAKNAASSATSKIGELENELNVYKSDNTLGDLNKAFLESGDRIKQLESQLIEARSASASTLEGLWAKSGGQVIEEAGQQYKIIEKTILNVK